MQKTSRIKNWVKGVIAVAILGFILMLPPTRGATPVRAQAAGISWEYQLDFSAASLQSAREQVASLTPSLESQGVASSLEPLGDSIYRLSMTGDQGMDQVRQVLFSSLMADFIGGAAEVEVNMPVGSLLDIPFKLESNLTTGYRWEVVPSNTLDFAQVGKSTYTTRSRGAGLPAVQTLVLRPLNTGRAGIDLVYRRPFGPGEPITRHLRITLGAQALGVDLSNPHPAVIDAQASSGASSNAANPIKAIPLKGVLPTSFDWRSAGIVPAVRDQSSCGGCWSFGTVGIMESAILKADGPLTDLSEQFLISCNQSGWSCSGGLTAHMYHYDTLGKNQTTIGAVLEADKPYTATNSTCTVAYNHPYQLSGWQFIVATEFTMPTVDQIKNAIYTYGPITAGVCADGGWSGYTGGVYNPTTNACSGGTNHQIILVGWDDSTQSWILRNSWGGSWGESGYMRIKWDTTGLTSRVGEGTSWVIWSAPGPSPFGKTSPANAATGQPTSLSLSWESSSGATSYEYCIDTTSNNTCDTSWVSTGTATSAALSSLSAGNHSWQVRAANVSGTVEANAGTWWSFTVGNAPGAFNKTSPANASSGHPTSLGLSWETSSSATSYEYCIDTSSNNTCNTSWVSTGLSNSASLSGLSAGNHSWQVRAVNASGTTEANVGTWWSFTVGQVQRVFLPLVVKSAPLPGSFNKSAPGNGAANQSTSPTLSWGPSSDFTGYQYCIDTVNNNICDATWISAGTSTSAPLSGLALSTTYYWQARASNAAGATYADNGTWWSFTTAATLPTGIVNGGFESGPIGWTEYSSHGWAIIVNAFPGTVTAHGGSYAAWLGGEYSDISYVEQQVTISPATPYLVYWHWIASADACGFDFGGVLVNGSVVDVYDLCSSSSTGGWVKRSVNLSAYAGQSVTLQIRAETDATLNSNLFVDDVSLQASPAYGLVNPIPGWDVSTALGKAGIIMQKGEPQGMYAGRLFHPR